MPHIAVSMIPGRSRDTKEILAQKLKECLMEVLHVEDKFVSVSVQDIELKDWNEFMQTIPEEAILVKPDEKV